MAMATLCTRMQPISRTALTQCDAPSVPPAHELAESRIIPQVPPPPVITRGKTYAVLGVRRQVLLEQLERLVSVPEQHPNERLIGDQLALAVDLGVGARPREQMSGAVARARPRQHGGHKDLIPQSIELRLLRGPQVSQLSDQVPGLGHVGVHVLQGQDPKLAFGEARI